jgi:hypothetical protein
VAVLEGAGATAGRLLGAADQLRRSPGRASGWALAPTAHADPAPIVDAATRAVGAAAVARAYARGAREPGVVVELALADQPVS